MITPETEEMQALPILRTRSNERGSLTIQTHGHQTLRVVKQNRGGLIETEFEISLEPDSVLHVITDPQPQPDVCCG